MQMKDKKDETCMTKNVVGGDIDYVMLKYTKHLRFWIFIPYNHHAVLIRLVQRANHPRTYMYDA